MVKEMIETNLRSAFAGESQAHIRYKIFAERAEKSGWLSVARLFSSISIAERIHAGNHFKNILTKGGAETVSAAVFGARNTSEDLQAGIDGETFEINEMYLSTRLWLDFREKKLQRRVSRGRWRLKESTLVCTKRPNKPWTKAKTSLWGPSKYAMSAVLRLKGTHWTSARYVAPQETDSKLSR